MAINAAALFDLDGVIFDTEPQYTVFWEKIGKQFFPDVKDFALHIKGHTLVEIEDRYFKGDTEKINFIVKGLLCLEQEMTYDYVSGVCDFIQNLRHEGIKTAIVTSSNRDKMANVYRAHPEVKELFDVILTAESFQRSKPEPDCYLCAAKSLNMSYGDCVVFEDSIAGLQAGSRAGMKVVGLTTTNSEEVVSCYADVSIPDYIHFKVNNLLDLLR